MHDYHLIPLAVELRQLGVQNRIGFYLHIPFPPWQTFIAIPEHEHLARCLAAYDLIGLQTKADVANLIDYMVNGAFGSIFSDGRIRLFDRLVTVGSIPIGIDVADFAKPRRDSRARAGTRREPHHRRGPARLHQGPAAEVQGLRAVPGEESRNTAARWC